MDLIVERIENINLKEFDLNKLSDYQKKKINNLHTLASYCLLDELLSKYNLNISDIKYVKNKPMLDNYYVSVSHKNEYVAVVLDTCEVAIDIEKIKEVNIKLDIILQEDEIELLKNSEYFNKTFFEIYTTKECIIKIKNFDLMNMKSYSVVKNNKIEYFDYEIKHQYFDNYVLTIVRKKE